MLCNKCNNEIPDTSMVCTFCGNVIQNPFDEMNKKALGMNRALATDEQNTPQPQVPQQQMGSIPQAPVQQQVNPVPQVPVQQQTNPVPQAPVQQQVEPNQINTTSNNSVLSIVSVIILIISLVICLYCGYIMISNTYNILKISSLLGAKYTLFFVANYVIISAAVIYSAKSMLNHPERSYVDDLIIGAIGISVYLMFFFGVLGLLKLMGIKLLLLLIFVAILSFYNAYFATKKLVAIINDKIVIVGDISRMLFATAMSIIMYRVAYEIFMKILEKLFDNPSALSLFTR